MSLKDIKIPADASDQQTTDAKSAVPPVQFSVASDGTTNVLTIQDRQAPQDRYSTKSYRVYWLPKAFSPTPVVNNSTVRVAARKVSSLINEINAPGLGTVLTLQDSVNFGQEGYYFCVAVNRVGVEAPVEHMVEAP